VIEGGDDERPRVRVRVASAGARARARRGGREACTSGATVVPRALASKTISAASAVVSRNGARARQSPAFGPGG